MKLDNITEAVFRKLLQEGTGTAGLGVYAWAEGGAREAVIYDAEELMAAYRKHGKKIAYMPETDGIFRGMIKIQRPKNSCNGAWEVKFSAAENKGDGAIVYAVGFALAYPEMMLIPDRKYVSPAARSGWRSQFDKGRPSLKLDDVENPKTPEPKDDCNVYNDRDAETIDRAYKTIGNEYTIRAALERTHAETMIRLGLEEKTSRKEVEKNLEFFFKMGASNLFIKRFQTDL
jgi:hypothetical protein